MLKPMPENMKRWLLARHTALMICLSINIIAHAEEVPAIGKDHCGGCHAVEKRLYAPSFKEISAKYRGDVDAANKLTKNINSGGPFGWSTDINMPAKGLGASDGDIKGMVEFILGLSQSTSKNPESREVAQGPQSVASGIISRTTATAATRLPPM